MQTPAIVGKYEPLELLGGGMSHVYRARDTVIDRPVVVKLLTDESCMDFLQEARLAGNIQHENIVSVFDFGEHQGRPFIVMEYLKGEDLRHAIRAGHIGSMIGRMKMALRIAEALEYENGRGTVHRDIKPENVHLDPHGRVKLMDFGMGTSYYMAPEQVAGIPATPLVDVYAFGMVFYELLTGVRGVNGDTIEAVLFQILNMPLDPTPMVNAGAPPVVLGATAEQTVRLSLPGKPKPRSMVVWAAPAALLVLIGAGAVWWFTRSMPPQPPAEVQVTGMIYIPAGSFQSGELYLDETEVSNADFAEYCKANGCTQPTGAPDLPVVRVKVAEAREYATWKGKRLPRALSNGSEPRVEPTAKNIHGARV